MVPANLIFWIISMVGGEEDGDGDKPEDDGDADEDLEPGLEGDDPADRARQALSGGRHHTFTSFKPSLEQGWKSYILKKMTLEEFGIVSLFEVK